ncbi:hypothetical protein ABENE_20415 [Asticcacaulis benevestitus DSM 16100 = ATCC BAA-896]|uniref:Uncharacterized protein n=1 Tax=Asticcacaulis benevestitus DSM 16100 = ATCC BAA-896 TaxID=1121022 RepID=V4QVK5_9CAUL|nr:hypothetical protein ABENE_20415 [Asticcacaulis benevestitus DSM 16100 = ATCC BAA-896]
MTESSHISGETIIASKREAILALLALHGLHDHLASGDGTRTT